MNWLAWRQHRKQFMVAGIFLVLFAAFMIPTGISFWHTYQHTLATCGQTDTCDQVNSELFQSTIDGILLHLVPVAIMFVPVMLALFWGVPFLAREYADGTNKLAWTQSVSRRRWLTTKLIWVLLGAAVITSAFVGLNTWWSRTNNALTLGRFGSGVSFSSQGVAPIGFAVFAVALGIMLGAWFRRTMAALGLTLVLLIVVLIAIPNFIRPHYETPFTYNASLVNPSANDPIASGNVLPVNQTIVNSSGQPINWASPPGKCIVTRPPGFVGGGPGAHAVQAVAAKGGGEAIMSRNGGPAVSLNCLQTLGYTMHETYQPAYRYWDFQRIETGLYLALSILPIGITYWLVLRRDA